MIDAIPLDQNEERAVQRARYMSLETIAPLSDNTFVKVALQAAWLVPPGQLDTAVRSRLLHHSTGHHLVS